MKVRSGYVLTRCVLLGAGALLTRGPMAQAQLIINVGDHALAPNLAGQTIDLFVENVGTTTVPVGGISLNVQVADSGPASKGGWGSILGPDITGVELLAGTIFSANNTGAKDAGSVLQFANWTTSTSSGSVSLGPGTTTKLATVTISTVGFTVTQAWNLELLNTINGTSKYFDPLGGDILPLITDGTISIVPEPLSGLVAALVLGAFAFARRRTSSV